MSLFTLTHRLIPFEHVAYALSETGYGSKPSQWAHIPPSMAFFVSNELIRQVKELLDEQTQSQAAAVGVDAEKVAAVVEKLDFLEGDVSVSVTVTPLTYIQGATLDVLEDMPPCDLVQDGPQTIVVEVGEEITFNVDVYDRYVLCYPNDSQSAEDTYPHEKELPQQGDSELAANENA